MNLDQLAQFAQILNVVLVAVSVFLIWRELRENARLTRAGNTHKMTEISSAFYLLLAQDKETTAIWLQGNNDFSNLTDVDQYRYLALVSWWLNFYENAYLQQHNKLLDQSYFRAWSRELYNLTRTPSFTTVWNKIRNTYSSDFITFIEQTVITISKERTHTRAE